MYDIIIIGAGISGSLLAYQLNGYKKLVIEKENMSGGVWYQTKWQWLCSDTAGFMYSPSDSHGKKMINKNFCSGIPRDDIIQLTQRYLSDSENRSDTDIRYNESVSECRFHTNDQLWSVRTNKSVYYSKWVIISSGIYQNAFIPEEFRGLENVIHSSKLTSDDIEKSNKIAVVGARESGVQIIRGIQDKYPEKNIDWYARSYKNWYYNIEKGNYIKSYRILRFLYQWIPFFFWIVTKVRSYMLNEVHSTVMDLLRWKKDTDKIPNTFHKESEDFHYDFTQPIRPIFTYRVDFEKLNRFFYDKDTFDASKYDIVICATGFEFQKSITIYVDDNNVGDKIDLFYLQDYVKPNVPNLLYCIPIAISTFIMLEHNIKQIKMYLENKKSIDEYSFKQYQNKVDAFLKSYNMTREQMIYHTRHPTLMYHKDFL